MIQVVQKHCQSPGIVKCMVNSKGQARLTSSKAWIYFVVEKRVAFSEAQTLRMLVGHALHDMLALSAMGSETLMMRHELVTHPRSSLSDNLHCSMCRMDQSCSEDWILKDQDCDDLRDPLNIRSLR